MSEMHWIWGLSLGLLANGAAEIVLALDLHKPWHRIDAACRHRRVLRWIVCMVGHAGLVMWGISIPNLVLFALFSISAATDFETCLLPPDWLLYATVVLAFVFAALSGSWFAIRDVIVAQAFCFAMVTLGVAFLNVCDSGDIKLAMQFGAMCGSLGMLAAGAFGIWLVACVWLCITIVRGALQMPFKRALQHAIHLRPPQGPLMWCGFLLALCIIKVALP